MVPRRIPHILAALLRSWKSTMLYSLPSEQDSPACLCAEAMPPRTDRGRNRRGRRGTDPASRSPPPVAGSGSGSGRAGRRDGGAARRDAEDERAQAERQRQRAALAGARPSHGPPPAAARPADSAAAQSKSRPSTPPPTAAPVAKLCRHNDLLALLPLRLRRRRLPRGAALCLRVLRIWAHYKVLHVSVIMRKGPGEGHSTQRSQGCI